MGAALARLHHDFDAHRFMLPEGVEDGYRWWLSRELENPKAIVLVAVDQRDVPVGYAYGRLEGRDWNRLLDRYGEVVDVWVDEPARRAGVGGLLVEELLRRFEAHGAPRAVLMSAWPNKSAQNLFARCGFRPTMVEMTRELSPAPAPKKPRARKR